MSYTHPTINLFAHRDVYTVSRLNLEVRDLLIAELPTIWIEGEISNVRRSGPGHLYFTLKDEDCQVSCAMFRNRNRALGFSPEDGLRVLAFVKVDLYPTRGSFQLIVEHMEQAGEGDLRRAFDALKARLSKEGLFDISHKQVVPLLPKRIGLITSPTGAAVQDILSVLKRRFPAIPVVIYPVAVQGKGSAEKIASMLDRVVADHRAATPSAAAELISPDTQDWQQRFAELTERLNNTLMGQIAHRRDRLSWAMKRLIHPRRRLQDMAQRADEVRLRLSRALKNRFGEFTRNVSVLDARLSRHSPRTILKLHRGECQSLNRRLALSIVKQLSEKRAHVHSLQRAFDAVGPQQTLERGYAIITREANGDILREASTIKPGEHLRARLKRGSLTAQVKKTNS